MPDGSIFGAPYPLPPSSDDERLRSAIERGQPEEIPNLTWEKPDFTNLEHKIVRTFAIDRKKRPNRDCVPCAMCSDGHPKFLEGAVLWSSDGSLRIIGNICAVKPDHFGVARYRKLQKERELEHLDSVAFNWLHTNIEFFHPLAFTVEHLRKAAISLEDQQRVFFQNLPAMGALLENVARRHGAALTVTEEMAGSRLVAAEAGGSGRVAQSQYEVVNIGFLHGTPFIVRPRYKRSQQFEGVKEALYRIPAGQGEDPMLALIEQGQHEITITAGLVFRALQRALKLADECAEAKQFVGVENLAVLSSWGCDPRNPQSLAVERFGSKVTFVLPDRSRASILAEWAKLPDLSLLRRIVEAGFELDGLVS